ncbi:hypothetical protein B2A_08188, partial [mine drainage metagenome]
YNAAWLERDGQTWMQAYVQDNIRLLHGRLHIYPGVKYTRLDMFSNDDQGYFYKNSGSITKIYRYIEDSIGVNYAFTSHLNAYVNWGQYGQAAQRQRIVRPDRRPAALAGGGKARDGREHRCRCPVQEPGVLLGRGLL